MQILTDSVLMNQTARTKDEALGIVARHLADLGLVPVSYLAGLKSREAQSSTYLGGHIAIPHGTPEFKQSIQKTGVAVVHFQNGVDWGNGDLVFVAVGISANSDEHLGILRQLTKALIDEDKTAQALQHAKTADDVVRVLLGDLSSLSNDKQGDNTKNNRLFDKSLMVFEDCQTLDDMAIKACRLIQAKAQPVPNFFKTVLMQDFVQIKPNFWAVSVKFANLMPQIAVVRGRIDRHLTVFVLMTYQDNLDNLTDALDKLLAIDDSLDDIGFMHALGLEDDDNTKKPPTDSTQIPKNYATATAYLANRHGLHARPATQLSQLASQWTGEVLIDVSNSPVSAKSLSRLLSLGVNYGQKLTVLVEVTDDLTQATAFANVIIEAIHAGLGEEVVPIFDAVTENHSDTNTDSFDEPLTDNTQYFAIGASKGIANAISFVAKAHQFDYPKHTTDKNTDKALLVQAINTAKSELDNLINHAKSDEIAQIFNAHKALIDDPLILQEVFAKIDDGLSAQMAWHSQIHDMVSHQLSLNNALLAERAMDLKDVGDKVLAVMCGENLLTLPNKPYVLIKDDLMPSDVARLDERVVGILTAFGGASSHSAIVARTLGIPAVVGAGERVLQIANNTQVLLDGKAGTFVVNPDESAIKTAISLDNLHKALQAQAFEQKDKPAITLDNHTISVMANLSDVANINTAVDNGADGVGLLRTELVFMKHNKMPDIETQISDYKTVFQYHNLPVVVRTLDIGGDKPLPYLFMKTEDNPFLGVRGVRLTLRKPNVFKAQLTALVKASLAVGNHQLSIMFPMIGRLEEWHKAHALLDEVLADYPHPNVQVGMMIEVPSAAIMAEKFAPFVDFFSIGTNDLTQYVLAIDRGHPVLSSEADGLHPSVLQLIDNTVKSAHKYGKWVGVCGELASDSDALAVLLGLGVDELSVSVKQIAMVKMHIRSLNLSDCKTLALHALQCDNASDVRRLVKDSLVNNT